jgi:DNA-directed RNA polymerase subunit RPC12/RpoP
MIKCPYCNSKSKKYDWDISIDGDRIILNRQYVCQECKEYFSTDQTYLATSDEEIHEEEEE